MKAYTMYLSLFLICLLRIIKMPSQENFLIEENNRNILFCRHPVREWIQPFRGNIQAERENPFPNALQRKAGYSAPPFMVDKITS